MTEKKGIVVFKISIGGTGCRLGETYENLEEAKRSFKLHFRHYMDNFLYPYYEADEECIIESQFSDSYFAIRVFKNDMKNPRYEVIGVIEMLFEDEES